MGNAENTGRTYLGKSEYDKDMARKVDLQALRKRKEGKGRDSKQAENGGISD